MDTIGANTGIGNALAPADGKAHPGERYYDEHVRLPAEGDAASALLREVIDKGASRGWKLISATKDPAADALLVTWDTSVSFSG